MSCEYLNMTKVIYLIEYEGQYLLKMFVDKLLSFHVVTKVLSKLNVTIMSIVLRFYKLL